MTTTTSTTHPPTPIMTALTPAEAATPLPGLADLEWATRAPVVDPASTGHTDPAMWGVVPAESNPDGREHGAWAIVAGDGEECDLYLEIAATDSPRKLALFLTDAATGHGRDLPLRGALADIAHLRRAQVARQPAAGTPGVRRAGPDVQTLARLVNAIGPLAGHVTTFGPMDQTARAAYRDQLYTQLADVAALAVAWMEAVLAGQGSLWPDRRVRRPGPPPSGLEPLLRVQLHCAVCDTVLRDEDDRALVWDAATVHADLDREFPPGAGLEHELLGWRRFGNRFLCPGCHIIDEQGRVSERDVETSEHRAVLTSQRRYAALTQALLDTHIWITGQASRPPASTDVGFPG